MIPDSVSILTLSALLLACVSCVAAPADGGEEGGAGEAAGEASASSPVEASVRYHQVVDPRTGIVQAVSPIPASWEVHPEGAPLAMSGPDGVKVHRTETAQFAWAHDAFGQDSARQLGHRVVPPLPLDEVVRQMVEPAARAQGNRLVRAYPVPEIEGFWQRFAAGMLQTGAQRQVRAVGTEWTDDRGTMTFVAIVQTINAQGNSIIWTLQTTSLEAPEEVFEEARAAYVYAAGNTQINPQWQQAMNGQLAGQLQRNDAFWEDAMARSRAAHQQRMAAIEQAGRSARQIGDTYSEILDINHAGYLSRDSMNSAGHSATIDSIGERSLIGNHETGEHYLVDAGSKYYWVGNDGRYFGTDDPLYDPRTDQRVNDVDWTKFVTER